MKTKTKNKAKYIIFPTPGIIIKHKTQ